MNQAYFELWEKQGFQEDQLGVAKFQIHQKRTNNLQLSAKKKIDALPLRKSSLERFTSRRK